MSKQTTERKKNKISPLVKGPLDYNNCDSSYNVDIQLNFISCFFQLFFTSFPFLPCRVVSCRPFAYHLLYYLYFLFLFFMKTIPFHILWYCTPSCSCRTAPVPTHKFYQNFLSPPKFIQFIRSIFSCCLLSMFCLLNCFHANKIKKMF